MCYLLAADPSLGRLDYESLPDQALMEMLVEDLNAKIKEDIQDTKGNFHDVCEWQSWCGLYTECVDERVTAICFQGNLFNEKQFRFDFIPALVEEFTVNRCALHGTLDTAHLPASLVTIDVGNNELHGSLKFAQFPRKLQRIAIYVNAFCGSCVLGDLPPTLRTFSARMNKFSGEVSLNNLPKEMEGLYLMNNHLSGSVRIENLPKTMCDLHICDNALSGEFQLLDFSQQYANIYV